MLVPQWLHMHTVSIPVTKYICFQGYFVTLVVAQKTTSVASYIAHYNNWETVVERLGLNNIYRPTVSFTLYIESALSER